MTTTTSRVRRGFAIIAVVALGAICLSACNRLSDGNVSSGTGDTFNAAGEATWAANTGARDTSGTFVSEASVQASLPAGWTAYTGAVSLDHSSFTYNSGNGTSATPYVFKNAYVYGCIGIHDDYTTIQDVVVVYDGSSECKGGHGPNDAAAAVITPGRASNDGTVPAVTNVVLSHVTVDGTNHHIISIFVNNMNVDTVNATNSDIITWVASNSAVQNSYIHDVAQLHLPGCNGYNDSQKDANGWWVCNPGATQNDPNWHQDYHRDTMFMQGSHNDIISDDYIVHSHLHYVAATWGWAGGNDLTDHSSAGILADSHATGAGAFHDVVFSNLYVNGGTSWDIGGATAGGYGYHMVWEHVRFDGAVHTLNPWGSVWTGGPCDASDFISGAWGGSSINGSYFNDNTVVDHTSAGSEVADTSC